MNDLQLHIYQLLQEMDSSENEQSENEKGEHVENVEKSKGKRKEKFLTLSSKPISLGERSSRKTQEIEEKPEVENLLHIITETESSKDKE